MDLQNHALLTRKTRITLQEEMNSSSLPMDYRLQVLRLLYKKAPDEDARYELIRYLTQSPSLEFQYEGLVALENGELPITVDSLAIFTKLIGSPDQRIRRFSLRFVFAHFHDLRSRIPTKLTMSLMKTLIPLIGTERSDERLMAVRTIRKIMAVPQGHITDEQAKALLERLRVEPSPPVQSVLLDSVTDLMGSRQVGKRRKLEQIDPRDPPWILNLLDRFAFAGTPQLQVQALTALEELLTADELEKRLPLLKSLFFNLSGTVGKDVREAALGVYFKLNPERPAVRKLGFRILLQEKDSDAGSGLLEKLLSSQEDQNKYRDEVTLEVDRFCEGSYGAISHLATRTQCAENVVRKFALGTRMAPESRAALDRYMKDPDPIVRSATFKALSKTAKAWAKRSPDSFKSFIRAYAEIFHQEWENSQLIYALKDLVPSIPHANEIDPLWALISNLDAPTISILTIQEIQKFKARILASTRGVDEELMSKLGAGLMKHVQDIDQSKDIRIAAMRIIVELFPRQSAFYEYVATITYGGESPHKELKEAARELFAENR